MNFARVGPSTTPLSWPMQAIWAVPTTSPPSSKRWPCCISGRVARPPDDVARRVMFLFIGGGAQRATLEQEVQQRRAYQCAVPSLSATRASSRNPRCCRSPPVSLNPKLEGLIVPSKFYGIAAAGRPTLFIGAADGEIAQLIDQTACGFTVTPGDAKSLVRSHPAIGERSGTLQDYGRACARSVRGALGHAQRRETMGEDPERCGSANSKSRLGAERACD